MSHVEASNDHPSKKKKRNHREGPKEIPRVEEPSSSKGKEDENVPEALHLRIEDDYNRMLQHFRNQFVRANCNATVIGSDIADYYFVVDAGAQVRFSFLLCIYNLFLKIIFPLLFFN